MSLLTYTVDLEFYTLVIILNIFPRLALFDGANVSPSLCLLDLCDLEDFLLMKT